MISGAPRFGTYAGENLSSISIQSLRGRYFLSGAERQLRRKRWHYSLFATPQVLAVQAVVDLGYAASAFLCAVDLSTREVLVDEGFMGIPGTFAFVNNHPGAEVSSRPAS